MPAVEPVYTGVSITKRPDTISLDYLTAYTFGPNDVGDSTLGPYVRSWKVRATDSGVYLSRENNTNDGWEAEQLLVSYSGDPIVEVDIAFEQAARPVIVAERAGEIWIYRFNPLTSMFVFENFGEGRNPRAVLDSPLDVTISDVLIFYIQDTAGFLCYRQQRDRYATEYNTILPTNADYYLEEIGFSRDNRVKIYYTQRDETEGQYVLKELQSTLYPYSADVDKMTGVMSVIPDWLIVIVVIFHTLYDKDSYTGLLEVLADWRLVEPIIPVIPGDGTQPDEYTGMLEAIAGWLLAQPVIFHTLYDIDEYTGAMVPVGTWTVPVVVFTHVLYDKDAYQASMTALTGWTLA